MPRDISNMKRVAAIGDIHGCIREFKLLYSMLEHESLDEIRHSGDLVDRGPDTAGVIDFCIEKGITGVMGNHDSVLVEWLKHTDGRIPKNPDKVRSLQQINNHPNSENLKRYLRELPYIHIDDSINTVFVHGGLLPTIPLYAQPSALICRLAMINPELPSEIRWFNIDRKGVPEADNRAKGWVRWYEVYNHEQDVVFGHTVWQKGPFVYQRPGYGRCIGNDTGCNWSGELTAVIMPDLKFISTPKTKEFTTWHDLMRDDPYCKPEFID